MSQSLLNNTAITKSESSRSKVRITENTPDNGNTKDVEIIVPLKCLSNFWRSLEVPLIDGEIKLVLTWSANFVITNSAGAGILAITVTKLFISVDTLSTQDNLKLLQLLKSGFRHTIEKYQRKHKNNI